MFVMAATDPTENIALSRNEVVRPPSGEPTWLGRFWNHSDSLYTDLDTSRPFLPCTHSTNTFCPSTSTLSPERVNAVA
jgi:hypothetical protein